MWSASDHQHMSRALQLAKRGLYSTDPNPRVGCVIVKNNHVIAEGWHQKAGQPHAEVEALNNATEDVSGATCYVTLEPCAHQGKTPPCTNSLIDAGVKKVVSACVDPNPLVSGKGLQQLTNAGIETASGLMEAQAVQLNPGFNMRMREGRPFVRCKLAMSLDGKTALANGQSEWISSEASRLDVQRLRARSSVIITGIGTVKTDDPSMTVRSAEALGCSEETFKSDINQPSRVVLDSELKISPSAKMIEQAGNVIIFHRSSDDEKKQQLENAGAELIFVEEEKGSAFLHYVLKYLAAEKETNEVLVEAGSNLAGEMLNAGLIDEMVIYIAPNLLGHDAKGLFQLPLLEDMNQRYSLEFTDVRTVGSDIRVTATINR